MNKLPLPPSAIRREARGEWPGGVLKVNDNPRVILTVSTIALRKLITEVGGGFELAD